MKIEDGCKSFLRWNIHLLTNKYVWVINKNVNDIEDDIFKNKSASIFWDVISKLEFYNRTPNSEVLYFLHSNLNLRVGKLIRVLEMDL